MTTAKQTKTPGIFSRLLVDNNLTQKAYLNAISATLEYGTRLAVGLIVTPFVVAGVGDVLYGIFRTLGSFTGYITAASGRPSQALKWTIANMQSSNDYAPKQRAVASAILVWLLFFPLLATLGGVLVWFAPFWIKDVPSAQFGLVRLVAALLVFQMILNTLAYLPLSILEGENKGYKQIGLSAALIILGGGLTLVALYLDTGLVGIAIVNVITTALMGLLYLLIVRRHVPWFGLAKPSKEVIRQFFGLSGWFLIWRLVMQLMRASDLVILGVFVSAESVTAYTLTKYAPETLISFVAIVVFGITPGLGGIIGAGDLQKARRVRADIMLLTWLITTTIGSAILLWNGTFMRLWVGAERYAGAVPNFLILILITQFVLIRNDANIIDLTLDISHKVLLGLCSTLLSMGIAILLVNEFQAGIPGLVVGLIAGRLLLSVTYPLMIGRFLGTTLRLQLGATVRPAFVTLLLYGFAAWFVRALNQSASFQSLSWLGFFSSATLTCLGTATFAFFFGLSGEQQQRISERAQIVLGTVFDR